MITYIFLILSSFVSDLILFFVASNIWSLKRVKNFSCACCAILLTCCFGIGYSFLTVPFSSLLYFATAIVLMQIFFVQTSFYDSLLAGTFTTLYSMCCKGIVLGMASLFLQKNMFQILSEPNLANTTMAMVMLIKVPLMLHCLKILGAKEINAFLVRMDELAFVCNGHMALFLFMLFTSYNYYYNLDIVWFSFAQALTSIIVLIIYFQLLAYGVRVASLLEMDLERQIKEAQMTNQLAQYGTYKSYIDNIGSCKTACREMLLSLRHLCETGEYKKALEILRLDSQALLDAFPKVLEFSNDEVCNALLFELHGLCISRNISLDASLYIPSSLALDNEDKHRLIQELCLISLDACKLSHISDKQMRIASSVANNWLTLRFLCSCPSVVREHGKILFFEGNERKLSHSLLWLYSLVEQHSGFFQYSKDDKNGVFSMVVSFHFNN